MELLFHALSDPTRRDLMGRLHRDGVLSLSAIAAPLPITRQAVTKHLEILRRAELVVVERQGRERLHRLNPQPLQAVAEWLAPYSAAWDRRLERLRLHLEESTNNLEGKEQT